MHLLQGRIAHQLAGRKSTQVTQRLNEQYSAYLHATNTKVAVFRDVIIEDDYNPLGANKASIRVPTGDIEDPVKRDLIKTIKEKQLMVRASACMLLP